MTKEHTNNLDDAISEFIICIFKIIYTIISEFLKFIWFVLKSVYLLINRKLIKEESNEQNQVQHLNIIDYELNRSDLINSIKNAPKNWNFALPNIKGIITNLDIKDEDKNKDIEYLVREAKLTQDLDLLKLLFRLILGSRNSNQLSDEELASISKTCNSGKKALNEYLFLLKELQGLCERLKNKSINQEYLNQELEEFKAKLEKKNYTYPDNLFFDCGENINKTIQNNPKLILKIGDLIGIFFISTVLILIVVSAFISYK